ncbi:MAG: hypothetical protein ACU84H_00795 [Gammaproteobacteria bacterium]
MKLSLIVSAACALALAVGIYLTLTVKRTAPAAEAMNVQNDHEELAALKKQVAQLSSEVVSLRHDLLPLLARQSAAPSKAGAADGASGSDSVTSAKDEVENIIREREESTSRLKAQRLENFAAIETLFNNEAPDPNWSAETADWVRQTLADNKEFEKIISSNVECRTSLCRLEATADNQSASGIPPLLAHKLGWRLPRAKVDKIDEGNGTTTAIMYLFREGYKPPQ